MDNFSGITPEEISETRRCLEFAVSHGASQARICFGKSILDSIQLLNGEVDKVSRNADRSITINLFVDGRYGVYSTNRTGTAEMEGFILKAIERTRMLTPDEFRKLPDPERYATDAVTGKELGLYDETYGMITPEARISAALSGAIFSRLSKDSRYIPVSEECEYSDSIDDNYTVDSQGFEGRHTETSFSFWSEITIQDNSGNRYSGYWWSASPMLGKLRIDGCSATAQERAAAQIGAVKHKGGKYTMVVDSICSARLAAPLLNALYGSSIQQKNSFLDGSLGKKIFPDGLTVRDMAWAKGETGSRLFDSEGIATKERDIVRNGTVEMYFINTCFSDKLGIPVTVDGPSRPVLLPFMGSSFGNGLECKENAINLQAILERAGDGILVTGFNGGNCNHATGCFSYGVEGFVFHDGRITAPVKEMLITGDMITLWNSLVAAGADAKKGSRWQIPSLAFENVDFA